MKETRRFLYGIVIMALAGWIILGCSSAKLTSTWRDPSYRRPPMKKILVIAARQDTLYRRVWEDELSTAIGARGVAVTQSYRLFSDAIPDTMRLSESVRREQFDGVLVVRPLPTELSARVVSGSSFAPAFAYSPYAYSYGFIYQYNLNPGYVGITKTVSNEVMLWSTSADDGHLVWGATGELIDPSSRELVRKETIKLIVPALGRQGFIPDK